MGAIPVWQAGILQNFHAAAWAGASDHELLGHDAFVERVAGVEQQRQFAVARDFEPYRRDVTQFALVGYDGHRALFLFEHAERDAAAIGQDRAMPSARAERADRCQRQQVRIERQDRPVGGQVVCGRTCRRRYQHPVANQFGDAHLVVDRDFQLGGLTRLAQQADLVDGAERVDRAILRLGLHPERCDVMRLGLPDPLDQRLGIAVAVHQEPDCAQVEPIGRNDAAGVEHGMQRLQHEAVAAENHDGIGFFERDPVRNGAKFPLCRFLRPRGVGNDQGQAVVFGHAFR